MPHFRRESGIELMSLYPKALAGENAAEILKDKRMMGKQAHSELALRGLFALHIGKLPDLIRACKWRG
jgi:hypothetical protein